MEFKLNEYHRNISDEELLNDLNRVADMLHTQILTIELYEKHGNFNHTTIARRFGSWQKAVINAGLRTRHGSLKNTNNDHVTDEQLLSDLRATANLLGLSSITSTQYNEHGKHGSSIIFKRFGKWEIALTKAGLTPTGFRSSVSVEELLEDLERVWIELGRQPTTNDIKNGASRFSLNSYCRKFGSWRKALEYFVEFINTDNTDTSPSNGEITTSMTSENNETNHKSRKTNRDINLRLRFKVFQRDSFKCCICGRSPATTQGLELQVDHIKPWSKGGETILENLQTLCRDCNLGKSDLE